MLRAVIIDDEPAAVNALELLISKHVNHIQVVATTTEALKGIALIESHKPEIVFLDITMPSINGFTLLQQLTYSDFNLVFTTAHQEYAIKAIKHNAFDYLLKPIDVNELKECITKIISGDKTTKEEKQVYSQTIPVAVKDGIIFIKCSEIIRLEASGSYTVFYLDNKIKQIASKSLKEYEAQLNPALFYRCHNSHLVNLTKVVKFISSNGFLAQMTDGSTAEIARKNKDAFLDRLKNISG
jgi:two-component system LytT family response regulator